MQEGQQRQKKPVWQTYLPDESATLALGEALGRALVKTPGDQSGETESADGRVLFLEGDLGAGKTTLCRGLLQALGHSGPVKSPTYTLVEDYPLAGWQLHHFDLYRLGDPEELEYMGIRDYFGPGHICLLEWPQRGEGVLPPPDLQVTVTVEGHGRRVLLTARTEVGRMLIQWLQGTYEP